MNLHLCEKRFYYVVIIFIFLSILSGCVRDIKVTPKKSKIAKLYKRYNEIVKKYPKVENEDCDWEKLTENEKIVFGEISDIVLIKMNKAINENVFEYFVFMEMFFKRGSIKDERTLEVLHGRFPETDKIKKAKVFYAFKSLFVSRDKNLLNFMRFHLFYKAPTIINHLSNKQENVRVFAAEVLNELSGENYKLDEKKWLAWWGKNGSRYLKYERTFNYPGLRTCECEKEHELHNKTIPEIIAKLASSEDGTGMAESAVYLLKRRTGEDFGTDAAKWRAWWEKNKDRILKEEAEKERLVKEKAEKE